MLGKKVIGEKDNVLGTVVGFTGANDHKVIYTRTKEIKVKIVDWNKYLEIIKKSNDNLKDLTLSIRSGNGIVFHGSDIDNDPNGLPILIDDECCGVDAEKKNLLANIGDYEMMSGTFFDGVGIFEKIEGSFSIYPKFYMTIDFDDVKKCFTGEEKELWEFMDSRYEYNPRIHTNMLGIVKLVNKQNTPK